MKQGTSTFICKLLSSARIPWSVITSNYTFTHIWSKYKTAKKYALQHRFWQPKRVLSLPARIEVIQRKVFRSNWQTTTEIRLQQNSM